MQVRDVMRRQPRSIGAGASLAKAGAVMADTHCGALPVLERDGGRVIGILTDRDICLALANGNRRPSDVPVRRTMSDELFTCRPEDDLRDALATMRVHLVRRLPVVGPAGELVGILTLDDVLVASCPRQVAEEERASLTATLRAIARREQLLVPA